MKEIMNHAQKMAMLYRDENSCDLDYIILTNSLSTLTDDLKKNI
jgi:hypothetical protein